MSLDLTTKDFSNVLKKDEEINKELLINVIKLIGPRIYDKETNEISLNNKTQLHVIKEEFIINILELPHVLAEEIIYKVISKLDSRKKIHIAILYYLIVAEILKGSKIRNIHPGEILNEEFLEPLNITAYKLAKDIGIPQTRISSIIKGKRKITADTAIRLSKYFGNSPKFWLGLQNDFDIEESKSQKLFELAKIKKMSAVSL